MLFNTSFRFIIVRKCIIYVNLGIECIKYWTMKRLERVVWLTVKKFNSSSIASSGFFVCVTQSRSFTVNLFQAVGLFSKCILEEFMSTRHVLLSGECNKTSQSILNSYYWRRCNEPIQSYSNVMLKSYDCIIKLIKQNNRLIYN